MKRELLHGTRRFSYTLTRKRVKRINARVTRDGEISVSAPSFVRADDIDAFILQNAARLLAASDKQKAAIDAAPAVENGASVPFLGKCYILRILRDAKRTVSLLPEKGEMILTLAPEDGEREAKRALSAYLEREAVSLLTRLFNEAYSAYFEALFSKPTLRFRRMRGSWGNCRRESAVITLNLRLLYAPQRAIEYVILHELTHMLHPDHSARFWGALSQLMPDYALHRAALKAVPIAFDRFL